VHGHIVPILAVLTLARVVRGVGGGTVGVARDRLVGAGRAVHGVPPIVVVVGLSGIACGRGIVVVVVVPLAGDMAFARKSGDGELEYLSAVRSLSLLTLLPYLECTRTTCHINVK